MFKHMSSTQCNHQHCLHTSPIYVVNDQLQLCIHLCSDDVKRQRQQWWYCPLIQIVYPRDVLSHKQTTSNQMGPDLESRKVVPPPPSLHHCTRFCTSRGAALSWSKMAPCSSTSGCLQCRASLKCPANVYSNTGCWLLYQLARDGKHRYISAE
jgi:hypothetical protein